MKNKKGNIAIISVIVAVAAITAGIVGWMLAKKSQVPVQQTTITQPPTPAAQTQPTAPVAEPKTEPVVQLSEQPNTAEFNKYFSEISLGKMPIGSKQISPPDNVPTKTNVFSNKTDQFCVAMTMIKTIPVNVAAAGVYDVTAKSFAASDSKSKIPRALTQGGSIGCESLALPIGKYEYKMYVNDILVSVIPFEVK